MRRFLLALLFAATTFTGICQKEFYPERWSRVYKNELRSLPKSALLEVDTLYRLAKRENNVPQIIKTLMYQSKFALTIEEDAELTITEKWKQEIKTAKPPLKNILESMLAGMQWEYLKAHRHEYYDRSNTDEPAATIDFRKQGLLQLLGEIDRLFQNSLKEKDILKKTDISTINEILVQAESSRLYRPTLFDLLAQEALEYYTAVENEFSTVNAPFVIKDPAYFETFETILFNPPDSLSQKLLALKLFKELMSFHANDKSPDAFVSLEIDRLQFLVDQGSVQNSHQLQRATLKRLADKFKEHPASAQANFELASMENTESDGSDAAVEFKKKDALRICNDILSRFPNSDGAMKAAVLKREILAQHLELRNEEFVPINTQSFVRVEYRNIDTLSFSAYTVTEEFYTEFFNSRMMSDSARLAELGNLNPDFQWTVFPKNPGDYRTHTTEVVAPAFPVGRFIILALANNPTGKRQFGYTSLQSTNLVLIKSEFDDVDRFQVVDRQTGRALEGAQITKNSTDPIKLITDKEGFASVQPLKRREYNISAVVNLADDHATFGKYYLSESYVRYREEDRLTARAFLFTDRSIYRPGQKVYFKGIMLKVKNGKSSLLTNQYVMALLEDDNGDEVGALRLKTNSYGSFTGNFDLPTSGVTGEYTLRVEEDDEEDSKFYDELNYFEETSLTFSVEEYKRPTFEVSFQGMKESFKVNDSVKVKGTAIGFSGAKLDRATITYHVTRNVQYPNWYYWYHRSWDTEQTEITEGKGIANERGEFFIKFKAIPEEKVSSENLPVFKYNISVDVTDVNGETRSGNTTVNVGYHSLIATITAPASIQKGTTSQTLSIATENLNGQHVPTRGTVSIFKLQPPHAPLRERPWSSPDLPILSEDEFKKLFPFDSYEDNSEPEKKKGKLMTSLSFDTEKSAEAKYKIDNSWEPGSYVMELSASDPGGQPVTDRHRFKLVDPKSKTVSDNQLLVFELDKPSYRPGETAKLRIGSASKDMSLTIDFDRDHRVYKTRVEQLSNSMKEIAIPVSDAMKNGFAIHYVAVNNNGWSKGTKNVPVILEEEKIEIETITFKDKLQPGEKQTWSFEIKNSDPLKKEAEILASMYDASLDQFKNHEWYFNPVPKDHYYSGSNIDVSQSFGTFDFRIGNRPLANFRYREQHFDHLDWFGFSFTNNQWIQKQYLDRLFLSGALKGEPSKVNQSYDKTVRKGYVTGTIQAPDGSALPGVNVFIKGTTLGTVTDANGSYLIQVGKNDELVFSFIGFATTEVVVGRRNVIDIVLSEDVQQLSEVIVTAFGVAVERRKLSSSVSTVVTNDSTATELYFDQKLAGRVAGVQITGIPGGAAQIMLRGVSSIKGDSAPLYIVDGVPTEASRIDKDDLATIEVLKGQAATALYGSRASNGVILITTKSGQKKLDEELAKVTLRKNFNETAFFFPQLRTDENGRIRFTFTTPESLTRWKLQLLAHNKELVSTTKTLQAVTQKELMVVPNAPRFLRIGDEIIFSTKVTNLTSKEKNGNIALHLINAVTGQPVDVLFQNQQTTKPIHLPANGNTHVEWQLKIPAGVDAVQYRLMAKAGDFGDGEQNALPILPDRMLVTETMPMNIREGQEKTFVLEKLLNSKSGSAENHRLTLEVTSNPAWYAVQSLPYLMEFPHECSEQTFARIYANILSQHIAKSNPKIKAVFDKWASSDALISDLEKNPELKSLLIQETPWVREARNENEQKKRIGMLFDDNTVKAQLQGAIDKLSEMQLADGGFTWFKGGRYSNRFITQHIAAGLGHLKKLNVGVPKDLEFKVLDAIKFLDNEFEKDYNDLLSEAESIKARATTSTEATRRSSEFLNNARVGYFDVHYLYMRSFFPEVPMSTSCKAANDFYLKQSAKYWQEQNLYTMAMTALIQYRQHNNTVAQGILNTLRERSISNDEMGMYWKENVASCYWHAAPIETQALMIEAFGEIEAVLPNKKTVNTIDELRIWLLKNKQTSQWPTTKATTEAIYALLLNGTDWLSQEKILDVSMGGKAVPQPATPEAGTGYFKTSWSSDAITPKMAEVKLVKKDPGIAWAGLYWQYFEDLDKITSADSPLKLKKKIFLVTRNAGGELLKELRNDSSIAIGSLLRVRIELKADRHMEFLFLKDMRASGLEPVDVLSEYKYQDGLSFYQNTRDASTNFFFDSIEKGTYVFEYDLRANNKGSFSAGIATIQSMYAPEFSGHSEGTRINIK